MLQHVSIYFFYNQIIASSYLNFDKNIANTISILLRLLENWLLLIW